MLQTARVQSGSSAASRSQLLLQQLQQKYAKSQQPSSPDLGSTLQMGLFDRQLKDTRQSSQLADIRSQPCHVDRPKLSKPGFGKLTAVPKVRQKAVAPTKTGAMPMRTRAEGGRKRHK